MWFLFLSLLSKYLTGVTVNDKLQVAFTRESLKGLETFAVDLDFIVTCRTSVSNHRIFYNSLKKIAQKPTQNCWVSGTCFFFYYSTKTYKCNLTLYGLSALRGTKMCIKVLIIGTDIYYGSTTRCIEIFLIYYRFFSQFCTFLLLHSAVLLGTEFAAFSYPEFLPLYICHLTN